MYLHRAGRAARRWSVSARFGGAQSYPSRTKDSRTVDFSTGSVGLGVGVTALRLAGAGLSSRLHGLLATAPPGRMIALMGDAELDEGNVFEALLEGWKHDVRNLWWIIDYNRQSLDGVVNDQLFQKIQAFFATVGWKVVTLKYGKRARGRLRRARRRGAAALDRRVPERSLFRARPSRAAPAGASGSTAELGGDPGIARAARSA